MLTKPYKIRVRRVRKNVLIDMMVPLGRGKYSVVETINQGPVSFKDAILALKDADFSKAPRLRAALVPEIT